MAAAIDLHGQLSGVVGEDDIVVGAANVAKCWSPMVQVLVSPIIVWLTGRVLQQRGLRLPLKLTAFFAATIVFSLSAIYEIIELWDEIYFGGHRIWGSYDTATDLQWDLCGIIVGTLFSCIMLRDSRDRLVSH